MSQLIHMDGDEVDLTYRLELSDDDLNKIKSDANYTGKSIIHYAYLDNLMLKIGTDATDADIKRMRMLKFEHGPHLKIGDKHYKTFMMNYFIGKLIETNKIGVQFYKKGDEVYLETEIFNP